MTEQAQWTALTAQKLVRYEALFKLLDDIQIIEDTRAIARQIATQWKYCANVAGFRLVVARDPGFHVIDGFRGEAQVADLSTLSPWDEHHWREQRPRLVRLLDPPAGPAPPAHLAGTPIVEIAVLPFMRGGRCIAILNAAARREPFSELDDMFVRLLGRHFADRIADILLRQQTMESLITRATRDALTGLLNRGTIMEQFSNQLAVSRRTGQPLSLILIDVDFFKDVNDHHGHPAGDEVLVELSSRLQAQTRKGDSLGRYGGEEFLLVLYPCDAAGVAQAAERFRRVIEETPFRIPGAPPDRVALTISLGTSCTAAQADTGLHGLLKQADDALYRSKAEGRNRTTAAVARALAH